VAVRVLGAQLMSSRQLHFACAAIALGLLGCGQKGPLYLPDKKASVVKPVTAAPDAAAPVEKIDPDQKDVSQQPPTP